MWSASVVLFAMAIAGHIAALSLIDVRPFAVYQHYGPWSRLLTRSNAAAVFVLAVQAAVCAWLAGRQWRTLVSAARQIAPAWCLAGGAALLTFSSAIPTESVERFIGEVLLSCGVMVVAGLNVVFAVSALPAEPLRRVGSFLCDRLTLATEEGRRPWDRRLPFIAASWVFVVSSGLAFVVFERVPHIDDSICYLFQAKYMSLGKLWLPRPPEPESFGVAHLIVDGAKWYGKFFPGWPAVLAVGVAARVPWLVNPLLAAASILLVHHLIRRIYGVGTAHGVTLLLSASPWLLFLSASLMAHAASLFWMLLALVAVDRQRERRTGAWPLVAGVSLGMLFLTRPFDAALVGPVVALWAVGLGARRVSMPSLLATGTAAALVAGLYFLYNAALTGNPFAAPHQLWAERLFGPGVEVLGFGPNVGIPLWRNADPLPGHGIADVLLNANKNFSLLNFELFGWAAGSLVLACIAMQPSAVGWRDSVMIGILVSVIGGHAFYWAPGGPDFGARYWYLTIVPLAVLTIRGADMVVRGLCARGRDPSATAGRVVAFIAFASVAGLSIVVPWRSMTKYHRYRDIGRDFQVITQRRGINDALIFVHSPTRSDYQAAFNFNPLTLTEPGNIFVRDLGAEPAAAILKQFPSRPVWIIGRESEADMIDVISGPFPPGTNPPRLPIASEASLQAIIR
jgi:hypothetical protein